MFEKKDLRNELNIINKRLENQDNWKNHELLNQDMKRKNFLVTFIDSVENNFRNFEDTIYPFWSSSIFNRYG